MDFRCWGFWTLFLVPYFLSKSLLTYDGVSPSADDRQVRQFPNGSCRVSSLLNFPQLLHARVSVAKEPWTLLLLLSTWGLAEWTGSSTRG
jgi:hypothetical protein